MKASMPFLRFSLAAILVLGMVGLFGGCQKKEEAKQEAQQQTQQPGQQQNLATIGNLQAAYGIELKHALWYDRFAKQAQKENLGDIAILFRALARSEQVHANNDAKLLKGKGVEPVAPSIDSIAKGTARQYLKLSMSNENVEQATYPGFLQKATDEGFAEAADVFKKQLEADARHGRLLKKAIELETNFAHTPYMMCPQCGYILGSDKLDECPVCKTKKDKFQKM